MVAMTACEPSDADQDTALASGTQLALAELCRRHAHLLVVRLTRRCADPSAHPRLWTE